jgi:crotonobetainyl-CoA:carnitine CoA-transferase CaiB-like acyl-CoA transferase
VANTGASPPTRDRSEKPSGAQNGDGPVGPLFSSEDAWYHASRLDQSTAGPLNGIRVLDLSAYIAGPYGCSLLADLGAEVIKVEPPSGDTLRQYPSTLESESRAFLGTNRSKLGIVLDLKQPEGQEVLSRLVAASDVLVHNFRPSVPPRLGIEYERLRKLNPRLIYCALTGYGETGPLKDKAGYDQVLQSITGICAFQGRAGEPEIVLGSIVDFYAASQIAFGVTAALFHRERTGEGQYVGVSLLRSALAMQSGRFIWAESEGREVGRDMRSGGITGIHPAKEGHIYISANTPHFWHSLCELIGLPELAKDPNYDTVRKRANRAAEIVPRIRAALLRRTALEWEEVFGDRVPCGAVRPIEDMFDHPQVLAEGLVGTFDHKTAGRYRGMAKPLKFSDSPGPEPFAAPALGQHTAEVLTRIGYSAEELERLRKRKVIPE